MQNKAVRHEIPKSNWHIALANMIEDANDGDIIVCHNQPMGQLAELARLRMCPDKRLTFEVDNSVILNPLK